MGLPLSMMCGQEARFRLNDINFARDEMPVKHRACRVEASTTELIP